MEETDKKEINLDEKIEITKKQLLEYESFKLSYNKIYREHGEFAAEVLKLSRENNVLKNKLKAYRRAE